jgi:hypothetical protein
MNFRFSPQAANRNRMLWMSAFHPSADIAHPRSHVSFVPILLQKSKIEEPQKARESRSLDFSAVASLFNATTEVRDQFWMKRCGPSRRRA